MKATTITQKPDKTWDIQLKSGDEAKFLDVGNIPSGMTWQLVKEMFENVGKVEFTEITEDNGKASCKAVVMMASAGLAKKAISTFKGADVNGRKISVKPFRM